MYMKQELKIKYYIRYADDFVILSDERRYLENIIVQIDDFLKQELKLLLHPGKVFIKTWASGVEFLGWVHLPYHRQIKTTTKNRIFREIEKKFAQFETVQSYLAFLEHGNTYNLRRKVIQESLSLGDK
jgi:RNA-directed DNA polymerase